MAIRKPPGMHDHGHSMPSRKGTSNLPPAGIQSGPHIGFSPGVVPRGPEIHARDLTANDLKPAGTPVPKTLTTGASGKPAALDLPSNGCTPDDNFRIGNC